MQGISGSLLARDAAGAKVVIVSELRAGNVKVYLKEHGIHAAEVTAVGLANMQPLAERRNSDGSDSPEGKRFNRRVEIVVRPR